MCSSLAVLHVAEGASGLNFFPQSLGGFFLGSLHQPCPLQSSVCCPCPAKHISGCRNTDCVRMWPWAQALLSLPSNPVFLKTSSVSLHVGAGGRVGARWVTSFRQCLVKLHPALPFLQGQGWDVAQPPSTGTLPPSLTHPSAPCPSRGLGTTLS